jgi:hypothetical protein
MNSLVDLTVELGRTIDDTTVSNRWLVVSPEFSKVVYPIHAKLRGLRVGAHRRARSARDRKRAHYESCRGRTLLVMPRA